MKRALIALIATLSLTSCTSRMFQHAYNGKLDKVQAMYDMIRRNKPETLKRELNYSLVTASQEAKLETVKYLISKGAEINGIGPWNNNTPLNAACNRIYAYTSRKCDIIEMERQIKTVWHLLSHGANVSSKNSRGQTPLSGAFTRAFAIGENSLTEKPRLETVKKHIKKSWLQLAKLFIAKGADINVFFDQRSSTTFLHLFAKLGSLEGVKFLVKHGANINIKDWHEWTAAHWAAHNGHSKINLYLTSLIGNKTTDRQKNNPILRRLRNLKKIYLQGLMSKQEYEKKRKELLKKI